MKKPSRHGRQHDELQTARSDMRKAAEKYAKERFIPDLPECNVDIMFCRNDFLAGVRWERRRRKRDGC